MIIIFGSLTTFGFVYKKQIQVYKDKEKELESIAKNYVNDYSLYDGRGNLNISKELLVNNDYIEDIKVNEEVCEGYVEVKDYDFKAYIDCDNYKTKGYKTK